PAKGGRPARAGGVVSRRPAGSRRSARLSCLCRNRKPHPPARTLSRREGRARLRPRDRAVVRTIPPPPAPCLIAPQEGGGQCGQSAGSSQPDVAGKFPVSGLLGTGRLSSAE